MWCEAACSDHMGGLLPRLGWDGWSTLTLVLLLHSESSMFVSKRRFILKTCGTTLLLQALVPLLELAREYCGFDAIQVSVGTARGTSDCTGHRSLIGFCPLNAVFTEFLLLPQEFYEASSPRVPSSKLPGGSGLSQPDFSE